jgi:asparagine synthase (glutamine-hydrolysing)
MGHRGSSRDEFAKTNSICLMGANRLEIVDREFGRQPFISRDHNVSVVFNGEIYNFLELREDLSRQGCHFRTTCDTEVLLEGYQRWGLDGLCRRIRGMFVFILYDYHQKILAAVRDPFGIKPLYWTEKYECLFFASEIKGVAPLGTEIHELGPGERLIVTENYLTIEKYSDPCTIEIDHSTSFVEGAITLRELISEAVMMRVQTDLPVAVLLGGIDSAVILSQAIKYHQKVTAFTIGRDDSSEDVKFAKRFCKDLNVPLKVIYTTEEEILSLVPKVISCIETFEPNHVRGGTLSYLLSRAVSQEGFRIALCGEGADELFGGYTEYASHFKKGGYDAVEIIRRVFIRELYKTQLKRVDRTSMAFTLEVRVPFLDIQAASFALSLPGEYLLKKKNGRIIEKLILREAFKSELPNYAVCQNKRVISAGAGFGSNADEGPFYETAQHQISDDNFNSLRQCYPLVKLRTKEEAVYFQILQKHYPVEQCKFLLDRPFVNKSNE